jgi:hypothetical protein
MGIDPSRAIIPYQAPMTFSLDNLDLLSLYEQLFISIPSMESALQFNAYLKSVSLEDMHLSLSHFIETKNISIIRLETKLGELKKRFPKISRQSMANFEMAISLIANYQNMHQILNQAVQDFKQIAVATIRNQETVRHELKQLNPYSQTIKKITFAFLSSIAFLNNFTTFPTHKGDVFEEKNMCKADNIIDFYSSAKWSAGVIAAATIFSLIARSFISRKF